MKVKTQKQWVELSEANLNPKQIVVFGIFIFVSIYHDKCTHINSIAISVNIFNKL